MKFTSILITSLLCSTACAATVTIPIYKVAKTGHGAFAGNVVARDTPYGLMLTPHLHNLSPGEHGFHIHINPSCGNNGLKAGGHWDPKHTKKHLGPYGKGHLGDLPVLIVNKNGRASLPVLAPRLSVKQIQHHTLMIHQKGDNYLDHPKPLGGGGARIACGIIPSIET